mgnify:CR=1 FL=1
MKKIVKSILARHTERVTSQMKDLFEIIETYRKIHGIDPLTGQVRLFQFYFFFLNNFVVDVHKITQVYNEKTKEKKRMPNLGSKFSPMSRFERRLISMVDKKGGIKEGNVSGFLSLTYSTSQDHWDFRSCLIECVARTSDDVKYELTKCGIYIDTLKEWLEEMKMQSSHESLVFKVLESLIELPVRSLSLSLGSKKEQK